ncbi:MULTISPECIES: hypothetical protein [unclassified Streptomyces]|uniref:hypothetical protein n=1 Tax=unclassified Streptomyces TaxID=2593676 RepID=UPI0007C4C2ED|nr:MULTISPECIES: hypothetical protein [unclassified Streptomyces]MCI3930179.1 hypothetical protein [Streptomyces sp. AN091965]
MVNNSGIGNGGPDDGLWVPDVDYVAGWVEARAAADAVNAAAALCGLEGDVRATPHADARGEAVVWMCPNGAARVAEVLALWAHGGQTGLGES